VLAAVGLRPGGRRAAEVFAGGKMKVVAEISIHWSCGLHTRRLIYE
jgi:hypothetical protein